MKKIILFMDNNPEFLEVHTKILEQAGYHILPASTVLRAEEILSNRHVHMAICDIRMEDDKDLQDISGLLVAQKETYRPLPKVMLTAHPSYEYAREALGPALDGVAPAVRFIGKDEGPEPLQQAVEDVFEQHVRLNWDLRIQWRNLDSYTLFSSLMEPDADSDVIPKRIGELEDLFRKLFYRSEQITIGEAVFHTQGQIILKVFVHEAGGVLHHYIVSCGQRELIKQEDARYEQFAPKAVREGNAIYVKSVETVHFAATAYYLVNGNLEDITTFRQSYQTQSAPAVVKTLDSFLNTTFAHWSERGKHLNDAEIASLSQSVETYAQSDWEWRVERLCQASLAAGLARIDYAPQRLTLYLPEGVSISVPNPILPLPGARKFNNRSILWGTIHGNLNIDTILVDKEGRAWLIYFGQAGLGPLLCDYASLEVATKLELLSTLDIDRRVELEQHLLTTTTLQKPIEPEEFDCDIQKILLAIHQIRVRASAVIGRELEAYTAGLYFSHMEYVAAYEPDVKYIKGDLMRFLHALISAALLAEALTPAPKEGLPFQAIDSLFIDDANKKVWVEGQSIILSPLEFDLLRYLYEHQEQLCSRTSIVEEVFGANYDPEMRDSEKKQMDEGRLNSTMSRLRKKVEPNPNHPKYIIAVRGEGYRLELTNQT